jgi:hypothetical protein
LVCIVKPPLQFGFLFWVYYQNVAFPYTDSTFVRFMENTFI